MGTCLGGGRWNEVELAASEITFEFGCYDNDDKIIECGVQILTEGSSQVENFETETNISDVDSFSDDDGAYEFTSAILSVCKTTKMQKSQGILALCKYIKKQKGEEDSISSSEVESFEDESNSIDLSNELVQEMSASIFEYLNKKGGGNFYELVLSMTLSLFQFLSKEEAEDSSSSSSSEVNSTNAGKELVLAMLHLLGEYVEKKEAESNEIVLKRIIFSLLIYIEAKEVEGSNNELKWGDASNELVLPVFLSLCEYIKNKEAEGDISNNQVNSGDASTELLLGMILSATEKIETQEAEDILSRCEDIIEKDAEGSSHSEVNSGHASNRLVLAILLRVFQYIKKEAEGSSGKREVENFEAHPSATRLLRKVFVGFILTCCLLAYLLSSSFV